MAITAAAVEPHARHWVGRAMSGRANRTYTVTFIRLLVASLVESPDVSAWLIGPGGSRPSDMSDGDRVLVELLDEWFAWTRQPIAQRRARQPTWPTELARGGKGATGLGPQAVEVAKASRRSRYDVIVEDVVVEDVVVEGVA